MRWWIAVAAIAAFFFGARIAGGGPKRLAIAQNLAKRHDFLLGDLKKMEKAIEDFKDFRETRESQKYVLTSEEKKLEKKARIDFHIFLERVRNNTLQVLAEYDRLLGKPRYVDPLRKIFGKTLDEKVAVDWSDEDLEAIVDQLTDGYNVKMYVRGNIDARKMMTLKGEMSLLSILLQIENVFDARLILKNGHLWFTRVKDGKLVAED